MPKHLASIHFDKAYQLEMSGETNQAIKSYKDSLKHDPEHAPTYNNLAILYQQLGKTKKAFEYFQLAIKNDSNMADAHFNLGGIFQSTGQHQNAIICYTNTLRINPDFELVFPSLYYSMRQVCDWKLISDLDKKVASLDPKIETPFASITRTQDRSRNLQSSKARVAELQEALGDTQQFSHKKRKRGKLSIGYVSDGFSKFPTIQNLVGILENHNKKRFRIYCYSLRKQKPSEYLNRVKNASHKYQEFSNITNKNKARKIYDDKIDILVDLKGHTKGNKFEIFMYRPSAIQVNYLGFVGSTGSEYHDYMIVDKIVIPLSHKRDYTEEIIYMPDTYWPTDDNLLKIKDRKYTRADFGLDKSSKVFCSFNRNYKIEPEVLDVWIDILKSVDNSVLWLLKSSEDSAKNIKQYAAEKGFDITRIVFAEKLPKKDHISRLSLADVGLDTFKVGGHTSTVDCLVAGVPVITMKGKHFASRVSSSILNAAGLGRLVTNNFDEYKKLAIKLAADKSLKIDVSRTKLFDIRGYTESLEEIYLKMQKRKWDERK